MLFYQDCFIRICSSSISVRNRRMASDIFCKEDARNLLRNRRIFFFGDSNVRALYKDLIWLLEFGDLIPEDGLKRKNELRFAGDRRISNGQNTNSRCYQEKRQYNGHGAWVQFEFLTRIFQDRFIETVAEINGPALLVINSCLWDISRYGPTSIEEYKSNVIKTIKFLQKNLPNIKVLWTTALPPSMKCRGGFLNENIRNIRSVLPFHVAQANQYLIQCLEPYPIDILDLHYHMRFLIDYRAQDGIHWQPTAMRLMTNLILTHLTICWGLKLPGRIPLGGEYASHYSAIEGVTNKDDRKYVGKKLNRRKRKNTFNSYPLAIRQKI